MEIFEPIIKPKIDFVLLAGGYAGSLQPLTEFMPKAMLPLGNKPILHHIIEDVTSHCAINKIYLLCNHFSGIIFEYVNLLIQANQVKEEVIFIKSDPELYDNGGILLEIKNTISSDFLLYYSDVLPINMNYQSFLDRHFKNKADDYLGTLSTSYQYNLETGYVYEEQGEISSFIEKPDKDDRLKNMAIGIFNPRIFDQITSKKDNFYRDVIGRAMRNGYKFGNFIHNDAWYHFQHLSKYHYEHVLNNNKWIK